jgi:excisionase family DNA binding protein
MRQEGGSRVSRVPQPPSAPPVEAEEKHTKGEGSNGRLLTADEVAALLAVPTSWVYAETRAGRLPHVKLGRYYRYSRPSIEAFVAGLERGPIPYRKYLAPGSDPGGSSHG